MAETSLAAPLKVEVSQLSTDIENLVAAAANLYDWLYDNDAFDVAELASGLDRAVAEINSLVERRESIRSRALLLRFFAQAYDDRLDGYVVRNGNYTFWRPREDGSEPKVEPLPFKFVSYHQKALVLVDQLLEHPLTGKIARRGSIEPIADAMPYIQDLTRQPVDLASEFIQDLQHEAVAAVSLGRSDSETRAHEGQQPISDGASANEAQGQTIPKSYLAHIDLAALFELDPEATRKKLERWRSENGDGWIEVTDRRQNEPKYLYLLSAVRSLLEPR